MEELLLLGKIIKEKRLSLNLKMDDVAKQVGITRSTLWSIEKGTCNCSIVSVLNVMALLGLTFKIDNIETGYIYRERASRTNTALDKKINRFIIMCVEQYALSINKCSGDVYKAMSKKGVIDDLTNDYEDLHGMSTLYLNNYIGAILGDEA